MRPEMDLSNCAKRILSQLPVLNRSLAPNSALITLALLQEDHSMLEEETIRELILQLKIDLHCDEDSLVTITEHCSMLDKEVQDLLVRRITTAPKVCFLNPVATGYSLP